MSKFKVPVEEFTTPDPVTSTEDANVDELLRLMKENGIRHLPILRREQVVGVISERDLKVIAGLDFKEKSLLRASDIMATDPVSVSSETPLDEVAFEMSNKKIGSVIVNEGNSFLGIFTVTDALNALIEIAREEQLSADT